MNETTANAVNKDIIFEDVNTYQKKIGNTTYIVTSCFNGDKRRNLASTLVRLINRDALAPATPDKMPKMGA